MCVCFCCCRGYNQRLLLLLLIYSSVIFVADLMFLSKTVRTKYGSFIAYAGHAFSIFEQIVERVTLDHTRVPETDFQ